jgi:hypothetical protein
MKRRYLLIRILSMVFVILTGRRSWADSWRRKAASGVVLPGLQFADIIIVNLKSAIENFGPTFNVWGLLSLI